MAYRLKPSASSPSRRVPVLVLITFLLQCLAVGDSKTSLDVSPEFSLPLAVPPLSPWQVKTFITLSLFSR
jgi:hypothetical protein